MKRVPMKFHEQIYNAGGDAWRSQIRRVFRHNEVWRMAQIACESKLSMWADYCEMFVPNRGMMI